MTSKRDDPIPVRIYVWLLRLYPSTFREHYRGEMLQLFRDCYRDVQHQGSRAASARWLLSTWADLIETACAERLQRMLRRDVWFGSLRALTGIVLLLASAVLLAWIVMAITVFLLIPWDLGIPPAGTLAQAVNDFFESTGLYYLPSLFVIACEMLAFARRLLSGQHRLTALTWRFTVLNLAVTLVSVLAAIVGMIVSRVLFPNVDPWTGDQGYGVALVYWGLIVVGSVLWFFARQVWRASSSASLRTYHTS